MSQENVELARRAFEAFERTHTEGARDLYELLDPDVEWLPLMAILEGTTYRGREGVRQWIDDVKRDWAAFDARPEHFRDVGNERVLVLGAWRARGRKGDVLLDLTQAAWLLQFRKGKLLRMQTFTERTKALEAVGLSEQDAHADS
jgi:ketosteroid isomerase-like protein